MDSVARDPARAERKAVCRIRDDVRRCRSHNSVTIVVAKHQRLGKVENVCRQGFVSRLFKGHFPVVFVTLEDLRDEINNIHQSRASKVLTILVSDDIYDMKLDVPGSFTRLTIIRCATTGDPKNLFIDGRSTYNNVRFDRWEDTQHKKHSMAISSSAGIAITMPDFGTQPPWGLHESQFTAREQQELDKNIADLSKKSSWRKAKAPLAAILGLVAGVGKIALDYKAVTGGFHVKASWGKVAFDVGAAATKVSMNASMVGGAVLLGAGIAGAIYFIPWDSFFGWLKRWVLSVWRRICEWWDDFMSKMNRLFHEERRRNIPQHHTRMAFL